MRCVNAFAWSRGRLTRNLLATMEHSNYFQRMADVFENKLNWKILEKWLPLKSSLCPPVFKQPSESKWNLDLIFLEYYFFIYIDEEKIVDAPIRKSVQAFLQIYHERMLRALNQHVPNFKNHITSLSSRLSQPASPQFEILPTNLRERDAIFQNHFKYYSSSLQKEEEMRELLRKEHPDPAQFIDSRVSSTLPSEASRQTILNQKLFSNWYWFCALALDLDELGKAFERSLDFENALQYSGDMQTSSTSIEEQMLRAMLADRKNTREGNTSFNPMEWSLVGMYDIYRTWRLRFLGVDSYEDALAQVKTHITEREQAVIEAHIRREAVPLPVRPPADVRMYGPDPEDMRFEQEAWHRFFARVGTPQEERARREHYKPLKSDAEVAEIWRAQQERRVLSDFADAQAYQRDAWTPMRPEDHVNPRAHELALLVKEVEAQEQRTREAMAEEREARRANALPAPPFFYHPDS